MTHVIAYDITKHSVCCP